MIHTDEEVRHYMSKKKWKKIQPQTSIKPGAVVVAQLAEQSFLSPEICGSNPNISNEIFRTYICQLLSRKDGNKEKEAGNGPFKKKNC